MAGLFFAPMNRIFLAVILSLLALSSATRADGPDEQYVQAYRFIQQGDELKGGGNQRGALERYYAAEEELRKIQRLAPAWQTALVGYRLNAVRALIAPLAKQFPDVLPPSGQPCRTVLNWYWVRSMRWAPTCWKR